MVDHTPTSIHHIYNEMSLDDEFIAAPSGWLYTCPDALKGSQLEHFAQRTVEYMKALDQVGLNQITGKPIQMRLNVVKATRAKTFFKHDQIKCMSVYNYWSYPLNKGRVKREKNSGKLLFFGAGVAHELDRLLYCPCFHGTWLKELQRSS